MAEYMDLTLAELAEVTGGKLTLKEGDKAEDRITCVEQDSRLILQDGAFLAIVGERVDGHRFIPQVAAQGAKVVICTIERTDWPVEEVPAISSLLVEDIFVALKEIATYYREKTKIQVVGITGSVGKTSTKECIATVLAEKYKVLKTEKNYNNEIGVPLMLLRIRPSHEVAVIEMGISDFEEMHRLSAMAKPDICVITNIGQCHLESLKTRDGILQAKTEIFDFMPPDGKVILNGDDDKLQALKEVILGSALQASGSVEPYFFALENCNEADAYAFDVQGMGLKGSRAQICVRTLAKTAAASVAQVAATETGEKSAAGASAAADSQAAADASFPATIPQPGRHMVLNAAAASLVGALFGLKGEEIAVALSKMQAVAGRTHIMDGKNLTLIDDCYNANPVSMKAGMDLLSMADTAKVAILGDMFELGENSDALHGEVGAYAAAAAVDVLVFVGENAVHMAAGAKAVLEKMPALGTKVFYFATLEALKNTLATDKTACLPQGATVLLKASHGMHFENLIPVLLEV